MPSPRGMKHRMHGVGHGPEQACAILATVNTPPESYEVPDDEFDDEPLDDELAAAPEPVAAPAAAGGTMPLPPVPSEPVATPVPVPEYHPPVRAPRLPATAQRTSDGSGWRTANLALRRGPSGGDMYLDVQQSGRLQSIYLNTAGLRRLVAIALSPEHDTGYLWRKLSEIPLDRPLPSRQLEEELRVLLQAYSGGAPRRSDG